jgi:hypothetical protein
MIGETLDQILAAIARHRGVVVWMVALVTGLALTGGAALGAVVRFASDPASTPATAPPSAVLETLPPGRATVQGVVLEVRPRGLLLRMGNGRRTIVITDAATVYRRDGRSVPRATLQRGQRVLALGHVGEAGFLRARVVALRGQPRPPQAGLPDPTTARER